MKVPEQKTLMLMSICVFAIGFTRYNRRAAVVIQWIDHLGNTSRPILNSRLAVFILWMCKSGFGKLLHPANLIYLIRSTFLIPTQSALFIARTASITE